MSYPDQPWVSKITDHSSGSLEQNQTISMKQTISYSDHRDYLKINETFVHKDTKMCEDILNWEVING